MELTRWSDGIGNEHLVQLARVSVNVVIHQVVLLSAARKPTTTIVLCPLDGLRNQIIDKLESLNTFVNIHYEPFNSSTITPQINWQINFRKLRNFTSFLRNIRGIMGTFFLVNWEVVIGG